MVYIIEYSLWYKLLNKILYKSCFPDLERIKIIYINFNGKNCFAFRTIPFSNSLLERIMFDNRGLTVYQNVVCFTMAQTMGHTGCPNC